MKKNKFRLTLFLMICLMLASSTPAAATSTETGHHTLDVTVAQTVDAVSMTEPSFTYQIIPIDETSEMPVNGDELTLTGTVNGEWIFDLDQLHVGDVRHYQIVQEESDRTDFSKDDRVYDLEILALQGEDGITAQMILSEDGEKTDTVSFSPKFIGTAESDAAVGGAVTSVSAVSKNADTNSSTGIVSPSTMLFVFLGAGMLAVLVMAIDKKKSKA